MATLNFDLEAAAPALLASLRDFMEMWGHPDSHSESKRAQAKRAAMWDRANAAVAKAEGVKHGEV